MKFERKCSYDGPYHAVFIMVSGCIVLLREESTKPTGSLKRTEQHWKGMPNIDSGDAKHMADKSTKIREAL